VDTPETLHPTNPSSFLPKSFHITKRMVEGKNVKLEYEGQKFDKYGRTLAYVYLPDGTFLNAEIINRATALLTPNTLSNSWRSLDSMKRKHGNKMWAYGKMGVKPN